MAVADVTRGSSSLQLLSGCSWLVFAPRFQPLAAVMSCRVGVWVWGGSRQLVAMRGQAVAMRGQAIAMRGQAVATRGQAVAMRRPVPAATGRQQAAGRGGGGTP